MSETVERSGVGDLWWLGVVEGVVTLLFGIAALFWPGLTLVTLVYLFSAYVLVWGVIEIIKGLLSIDGFIGSWWLTVIFGIFSLGVGVYLVRHPGVSFATLILLLGFVLIIRGIFDIVSGIFDQKTSTVKALYIISGLLALVVGIVVLQQPVASGVTFVWLLGLYALVLGPLSIVLSVQLRNEVERTLEPVKR